MNAPDPIRSRQSTARGHPQRSTMAHRQRWISSLLSILIGGTAIATGALPVAAGTSGPADPSVRLYSARAHITAQHFKGQPAYIDPGSPPRGRRRRLADRCRRPDYDHPITAEQVIKTKSGLDVPSAPCRPRDRAAWHAEFFHVEISRSRRPPGALPLLHVLPVGHGHARLTGRPHEPDLSARLLHRALHAGLRLGHRPGLGWSRPSATRASSSGHRTAGTT